MRFFYTLVTFANLLGALSAANDALIAAVATRSAKFPTLDARFHVKETLEKGSRFNEPGKVLPPNDLIWESDNRWVIDGGKYR